MARWKRSGCGLMVTWSCSTIHSTTLDSKPYRKIGWRRSAAPPPHPPHPPPPQAKDAKRGYDHGLNLTDWKPPTDSVNLSYRQWLELAKTHGKGGGEHWYFRVGDANNKVIDTCSLESQNSNGVQCILCNSLWPLFFKFIFSLAMKRGSAYASTTSLPWVLSGALCVL